jgi:excisionase family DNA binding protein
VLKLRSSHAASPGVLDYLGISGLSSAMKRISSDIPSVLTVNELAHYLKVHPGTVYRLLKAGKLPGFRVGSDWRLSKEEVERWLVELEKKQGT